MCSLGCGLEAREGPPRPAISRYHAIPVPISKSLLATYLHLILITPCSSALPAAPAPGGRTTPYLATFLDLLGASFFLDTLRTGFLAWR